MQQSVKQNAPSSHDLDIMFAKAKNKFQNDPNIIPKLRNLTDFIPWDDVLLYIELAKPGAHNAWNDYIKEKEERKHLSFVEYVRLVVDKAREREHRVDLLESIAPRPQPNK